MRRIQKFAAVNIIATLIGGGFQPWRKMDTTFTTVGKGSINLPTTAVTLNGTTEEIATPGMMVEGIATAATMTGAMRVVPRTEMTTATVMATRPHLFIPLHPSTLGPSMTMAPIVNAPTMAGLPADHHKRY
jgi:hypothetical protein